MHSESGQQIAQNVFFLLLFFDVAIFLFSCLVSGPTVMPISLLAMELRQFLFIRVFFKNLEIGNTLSEFWPLSGDWSGQGL